VDEHRAFDVIGARPPQMQRHTVGVLKEFVGISRIADFHR
jgi:hypothetical protein